MTGEVCRAQGRASSFEDGMGVPSAAFDRLF
jgi:hypothetical protein